METSYQTIEVDRNWINKNIQGIQWQRKIYPARVNKFVNYIRNGTFRPHSLLTVYKDINTGKYILIDGQHKVEAVKKENYKTTFDLRILKNIENEGLMDEYETAADVKQHRNIDIIKLYIYGKKHEWLEAFLDNKYFPINVSLNGGVNSLRIDNLIHMIYNGFKKDIIRVGLSKQRARKFIESIDSEIYRITKDFFSVYKKCFGDPSQDNWMYKTPVVFTLMRIWLANKDFFNEDDIITSFKKIEQSDAIRQESHHIDKYSLENLTRKMYRILSKNRSAHKFIIFWDEDLLL